MVVESLEIAALSRAYAAGDLTPEAVLDAVCDRIAAAGERPVWITLVPRDEAGRQLAAAQARRDAGEDLPLFGIPFAVKDNIDVAGLPTTAACPGFAHLPERSATVVDRLLAAGAVLIGKTNLDQFATGLVGTRTPYGICSSVFDPRYVSGGSSAGSGVAVAAGLVSFALGTDTAGSGRVPAAFNNIVGLKPTKGLVSTRGVLPACRTQDCVSVFAGTCGDALAVLRAAADFDAGDAYSRRAPATAAATRDWPRGFRFGVPREADLEFFGDAAAEALFADAAARLERLGGTRVEIDFAPFRDTAPLLYAGPWVAERLAVVREFADATPDAIDPVVRDIILGARRFNAVDAFAGQYRLAELARAAEAEWARMDVLLLPTTGTTYTVQEVLADPVRLNTNLGYYTNFVNLMDLSAVAVPAGFRAEGLPFGVTLIGRAFADGALASLADRLHRDQDPTIGATGHRPVGSALAEHVASDAAPGMVRLAVVGAHLTGQPLSHQLTGRGARLVATTRTACGYRLFSLPGTVPPKPGLVRDSSGAGGIEVEVWELGTAAFGSFVAEVPPPMAIGTLELADGTPVKGFTCEPAALTGAEDITIYGGWRGWLASRSA